MLKNESAQNTTKLTPLRLSRLPDSGGIIFMSNGVRMKKISHSVRQAKQAKFWMLAVPVHTGHVSVHRMTRGRTIQVTWQHQGTTCGRSIRRHVAGPYRTRGSSRV
jgi:hypothetical protein